MTEFFSKADVDAFFDKFEDPSLRVDLVDQAIRWFDVEGPKHCVTEKTDEIRKYFIERLIMKSYRYGKSHGFEGAMRTIRERGGR